MSKNATSATEKNVGGSGFIGKINKAANENIKQREAVAEYLDSGGQPLNIAGMGKRRRAFKLKKMQIRAKTKELRLNNRLAAKESRNEAKMSAYENGINPNEAVMGGISSMVGSAAGAVSSIFGKGGGVPGSEFPPVEAQPSGGLGGNKMLLIIGGAFLALMLLMKGKK